MILEKNETTVGLLIKYDSDIEVSQTITSNKIVSGYNPLNIGFIGAGNFAQNAVLPRLKGMCNFTGIVTAEGNISRYVAEKYGFQYCADNAEKLLEDKNIGTLFIMTRHD